MHAAEALDHGSFQCFKGFLLRDVGFDGEDIFFARQSL